MMMLHTTSLFGKIILIFCKAIYNSGTHYLSFIIFGFNKMSLKQAIQTNVGFARLVGSCIHIVFVLCLMPDNIIDCGDFYN